MTRLDRFIARMQAQRVLLNQVCERLNAAGSYFPGPVIELGLGNGRTFDHLRAKLTGRRIVVFEREVTAHPDSMPPIEDLVVGEITVTGPAFARQNGATAVLVHADLGNGRAEYDRKLQAWMPDLVHALTRPEGLVITSTELSHAALVEQPLPEEVVGGKYFVYRRR